MSKVIVIRKNIQGGLNMTLENINDISQVRKLVFDDRRPTHRVGVDFALSIFTDPVLFDAYTKGMFVVENKQDFYKQAEEVGVYYNFDEKKKGDTVEKTIAEMNYVSESDILATLKSPNTVALKQKLGEATPYLKSQYLYVASENVKLLPYSNIEILEEILGTIIAKDNSEE